MPEPSNYWKLADNLTVVQAALLIVGEEPAGQQEYILGWKEENRLDHFDAVYSAIKNAVISGTLKAVINYPISWIENPDNRSWIQYPNIDENTGVFEDEDSRELLEVHFKKTPDWQNTTIAVNNLKAWLFGRGIEPPFFFTETSSSPDYLNENHPRYSARLAAAIKAWLAMEDANLYKGKSPKIAMSNWLESRYIELGLIYQEGINNTAIDDCSKIANWNDKGGATKTP